METKIFTDKLKNNGWLEGNIPELTSNNLNRDVSAYFIYKNKLSLRYHAKENFIRLMVFGKTNNEDFKVNYISKIDKSLDGIGYNDVRGFQIDCKKNLDDVLNDLLSMQDTITLDSYFDFYLKIQSVGEISILAVEQFI
jgi:hypothetical protein